MILELYKWGSRAVTIKWGGYGSDPPGGKKMTEWPTSGQKNMVAGCG